MTPKPETSGRKLEARLEAEVGESDTAAAFGPDFPAVASTPFVLGLAELASHRAVSSGLAPGEITVGIRAEIEHLIPSKVGSNLVVHSVLTKRVKRRLWFRIEVSDGSQVVARIRHIRAVTTLDRFRAMLQPPTTSTHTPQAGGA
jgi:fluoroacetyl-CoA thioesterase